jgi:D-alanyl-D-alanine carboxypeptidase
MLMWVSIACAATALAMSRAQAEALLVIDVENGKVLYAQNAGYPWHPASVTKLMTAYVTLRAVNEGRLKLDTPLVVSANAAAQSPVKMGFAVGTVVTVDNALKMLMVKSANDMAVVLAEGVAGSIESFADEMNATARRLGMIQSSFVNPNGLPADDQMTSARDLAILARAILRDLPEYDYYWHLPGIRMGKMVRWNYNTLLGRYPGADGMKTGFICASGFNLVASATRNGRRLIASGRRARTRTTSSPTTIPSLRMRSSSRVSIRERRRALRRCRTASWASRCSSIPAPSRRRRHRRRRVNPSRKRRRPP